MTDHDAVADLADRARAMSESQFAIEWGALTDAECDEFMALMDQLHCPWQGTAGGA